MPRCKALARGGSRRCRRNALKGQVFCSVHGGSLATQYRDNRSKVSTQPFRSASVRPSQIQERISSGSLANQKTRRVLNPAFTQLSIDNPLVQHALHDKIGDFERTFAITSTVSLATAPWLNSVRWSSPQGFLASSLVVGIIAAPIIAYVNTADTYRDLLQFAGSGELHGTKLMGESHH